MQMEEPAQRIWRLARDLCPDKPLGEKGRAASGISAFAADWNHSNPSKCGKFGLHLHQSSSRWNGRFEKRGTQSVGRTRGGWNTKLHMAAASDRDGVIFSLSAGNCSDGPEGRALLRQLGPTDQPVYLLMDRAYEGDETRALAVEFGYISVVAPKRNRKILGTMISNCTNSAISLKGFFAASNGFAVFSLAMINWMLFSYPLFILLSCSTRLCEQTLEYPRTLPSEHEQDACQDGTCSGKCASPPFFS